MSDFLMNSMSESSLFSFVIFIFSIFLCENPFPSIYARPFFVFLSISLLSLSLFSLLFISALSVSSSLHSQLRVDTPTAIRRLNMYAPAGDVTHFGQAIEPFNVPRMWSDVMVRADVAQREAAAAAFNAANRYRKRALCVLPTKFGMKSMREPRIEREKERVTIIFHCRFFKLYYNLPF